ncbi:MAG: methyltransferase domain-containing protein [Nitrospirae bacterium]|nr:methyltransferase domain-containing protein [Nitrospirota bacterium]
MSDNNESQEQEMKKKLREAFNSVAVGYDNPALRFFPESAKHLSEYLNLKGDEHVLDVATGTGHAAMALAAVLPQGRVTGIDFSEGMLARAKAKIEERDIRNIDLLSMDMQALDFPENNFDAAVFSFSIFFVEDMEGMLRRVMEKVKPGGRVLATSFQGGTFSPQVDMFFERIEKFGVETPPTWRRLSTQEECAALFEKAGLSEVRVNTKDISYYLTDAGQWWDIVWNAGLRRFVSSLTPKDLERFRREHLREIECLSGTEGIRLEMNVLYSAGVIIKPE